MKKRILSLLMVGAMTAGMLAGCGSKAPADNTAKEEIPATEEAKEETPATEEKEAVEPVTLNVAYMPNYGSLWSVENAIDQGYLEEEGITVNLVEFQDGPTIISAMESGSIDVGYIGQGAHKLCINGKATIFALSHISNGDALIGGEGITSVEDLKGKRFACQPAGFEKEFIEEYKEKNDPNDEIEVVITEEQRGLVVNQNKADAHSYPVLSFDRMIEEGGLNLKQVGENLYEENNAYPFLKDCDEELYNKFNEALKSMKEDGFLTNLYNEYFGMDISESVMNK